MKNAPVQHQPPPPPTGTPKVPVLYSFLVGFAALVAVTAVVSVGLSGLLAGHGWASMFPLADTIKAWSLAPGDPASVWPSAPTPGPAGVLYTLLAVIAAGLCTVWWKVAIWWGVRQMRRRGHTPGGHRTASTKQVAGVLDEKGARQTALRTRESLKAASPRTVRRTATPELVVPLGLNAVDDHLLAVQNRDSVCVVGTSGSGKTARVAAGKITTAPGPAVVTTTKKDLLFFTWLVRASKGEVLVFDPEDITSWPDKIRWSLIAGCKDIATAKRRGMALAQARPLTEGTKGGGYFVAQAGKVLECYLHAAAVGGCSLADFVRWLVAGPKAQPPRQILAEHSPDQLPWLTNILDNPSESTGDVLATLTSIADPLSDPRLVAALDCRPEESFDIAEFIESGGDTLYLVSDGGDSSVAPIASTLANELHHAATRRAMRMPEGRNDPPIRFVLDEMANVAPFPNLNKKLTDSGGRGISMWVFIHNLDQIRDRFGATAAADLIKAVSARMLLPGLLAHDDLEDFSRLMGEHTEWRPSTSNSTSTYDRRDMSTDELRQLGEDEAVLIYRNQPGVRLRLPAHFESKCGNKLLDRINADIARSNTHVSAAVTAGEMPVLPGAAREQATADPVPVSHAIEPEAL